MRRLFSLLVLSLVLVQLFMFPAATDAFLSVPVTTLPATNIGPRSATLNGNATLPSFGVNGSSGLIFVEIDTRTTGYFQYGTAPGTYTKTTVPVILNFTGAPVNVNFSAAATGLLPCTRYYARAVINFPMPSNYEKQYNDYLISFLPQGSHSAVMHGLGVGLSYSPNVNEIKNGLSYGLYYGNEIIFTTTGCQISTAPLGQGGGVGTGAPAVTTTGPVQMSNIVVQSATIATPTAAPGQKVDVTASVTNKGSANGDAKITLYVNGQEMESQGITVASGQTSPVYFSLSMNEPGTYTVSVGNVPAGSFTVDTFANNDFLIYGLIALFTIGIAVAIYMVTRKRTA